MTKSEERELRLRERIDRVQAQANYWKSLAQPLRKQRCSYCGKFTMAKLGKKPVACYLHADLPDLDPSPHV